MRCFENDDKNKVFFSFYSSHSIRSSLESAKFFRRHEFKLTQWHFLHRNWIKNLKQQKKWNSEKKWHKNNKHWRLEMPAVYLFCLANWLTWQRLCFSNRISMRYSLWNEAMPFRELEIQFCRLNSKFDTNTHSSSSSLSLSLFLYILLVFPSLRSQSLYSRNKFEFTELFHGANYTWDFRDICFKWSVLLKVSNFSNLSLCLSSLLILLGHF